MPNFITPDLVVARLLDAGTRKPNLRELVEPPDVLIPVNGRGKTQDLYDAIGRPDFRCLPKNFFAQLHERILGACVGDSDSWEFPLLTPHIDLVCPSTNLGHPGKTTQAVVSVRFNGYYYYISLVVYVDLLQGTYGVASLGKAWASFLAQVVLSMPRSNIRVGSLYLRTRLIRAKTSELTFFK